MFRPVLVENENENKIAIFVRNFVFVHCLRNKTHAYFFLRVFENSFPKTKTKIAPKTRSPKTENEF